jgi:hypothetical protein
VVWQIGFLPFGSFLSFYSYFLPHFYFHLLPFLLFCVPFVGCIGGYFILWCAVGMAAPCPPNGLIMNDLSFYFFYSFHAWRRIGTKIKEP